MKPEIPVRRLRDLIEYDATTGEMLWRCRTVTDRSGKTWNTRFAGRPAGYIGNTGYWYVRLDGVNYLQHRLAWAMHTGEWPVGFLDHINNIRTDNRISNLRLATAAQNAQNAHRRHGKKNSKFRGVYTTNRTSSPWQARICIDGRQRYIGVFACEAAAAAAYDRAARQHHGEFAITNIMLAEGLISVKGAKP